MTISNTTNSITVNGNGLTTTFSYDFYMAGSASYAVLVFTDTDGSETTITSSDFSITGVTDQDGGTFTYPLAGSPIAVSTSLRLSRILPLTQDVAIGNQGNFYPSVVEQGLDYLTMIAQQQEGGAAGSIDAQSLFGNPQASSAEGISVPLGSGLSFSGNTLVVSGISGSGTVTSVDTGAGLIGGPITGVGTIAVNTASITPAMLSFTPGMVFITSSTPTGVGTVTFSGITSSYTHLLVMVSGRSTAGASPGVNVQMTFNGDGGANYDLHQTQLINTSVAANSAAGQTSLLMGIVTWSNSTTSNAGWGEARIFNYKDTGLFKVCRVSRGSVGAASVGASWVEGDGYGQWRSTAAITQIDLTLSAGNYTAGSVASLYGMP